MKLNIRYSVPDDGPYLIKWLSNKEDSRWFPMTLDSEIEQGAKNWIGFYKWKASLTATLDGVPCAIGTLFLMPYRKVAHHSMFYMIVDNKYRRKGIGSLVLKNLTHLGRAYFKLSALHCEVFEGCPLISLLEKQDFHMFARQEKFVKIEGEYLSRILYERFFEEE